MVNSKILHLFRRIRVLRIQSWFHGVGECGKFDGEAEYGFDSVGSGSLVHHAVPYSLGFGPVARDSDQLPEIPVSPSLTNAQDLAQISFYTKLCVD